MVSYLTAELNSYLDRQVALARTDPLTGLANIRWFGERAELESARARRYGRPVSLIYFDIDGFKSINDTYGHQAGDFVLMEVFRAVSGAIRCVDLMARMGGDEFAVLMPEIDFLRLPMVVEKIQRRVNDLKIRERYPLTLSIGAVAFSRQAPSVADMVYWADREMYRAKDQGGDAVSYRNID